MYSTHAPMTAKACCILAHWACAAGATGPVAEWALAPGNSTGNYQRLIDTLLKRRGLADVQEGTLSLPLQRRKFTPRRVTPVPVRFLHESLHEEVRAVSKDELRRKMQAKEMPRAWHSHPVVQRVPPGELVIPTALYTDAAAYGGQAAGRGKSVVVISLVNLLTKTRHFGIVLRKHLLCKCGCGGWCSLYRALALTHWSCRALADGVWPRTDLDQQAWGDFRAEHAGESLGFRAAVLYLMMDWEAVCQTLGVPTWQHLVHPCPLCNADADRLHLYRNQIQAKSTSARCVLFCLAIENEIFWASP